MKLTIKGQMTQINGEWVSEFKQLNIQMKAPTPLKAVRAVSDHIMGQLEGKVRKCSIKVDEKGVFFLTTTEPRPLIKFIADCLIKNYREMSYEQLEEWFGIEDDEP